MSDRFSVGEQAIYQNSHCLPELNGTEVEVVEVGEGACVDGVCMACRERIQILGLFYRVRWLNGEKRCALPFNLRRKRPPLGSWHALRDIWSPENVTGAIAT